MDGAIMPLGLEDASKLQNIVTVIFDFGYDVGMIEKVCYKNWLRVLKETIK
jgi:membrane dipeptidase